MARLAARILAEIIFSAHTVLMIILLFGWLLPVPYYYVYLTVLALTLVTQLLFRYCLLTAWEFYFRRTLDPSVGESPYYLTYYSHKMFHGAVTDTFVDRISLVFMGVSVAFAVVRLLYNL